MLAQTNPPHSSLIGEDFIDHPDCVKQYLVLIRISDTIPEGAELHSPCQRKCYFRS